jgi:DNA-binding transcriptional LysR family regulator
LELVNVNLNLLVPLDVLLKEQSVSKAADRLHMGQPAMSSILARLRALFDDELLIREGRGFKLTPFAQSLKLPLAETLAGLSSLINTGTFFDPLTSNRVFTIIASDYVTLVFLRPFLEKLSELAPGVQIKVNAIEPSQLESLRRGDADLLIYPRELLPTNVPFTVQPLFEDEFVCVVDVRNDEVSERMTLEQMEHMPYLAASQGVLASLADSRLDEKLVKRNAVMTAQSFVMAPFMIPGTKMFTIVQKRLAEQLLPFGQLKIVAPPVELAILHESLVWSSRQGEDAGHIWLREQLLGLSVNLAF